MLHTRLKLFADFRYVAELGSISSPFIASSLALGGGVSVALEISSRGLELTFSVNDLEVGHLQ